VRSQKSPGTLGTFERFYIHALHASLDIRKYSAFHNKFSLKLKMDSIKLSQSRLVSCNYGIEENSVFELHLFTLMHLVPVSYILLFNNSLRRFYTPLARIVNASLLLSFVSCAVFFYNWNFAVSETDGTCTEIFLSRLTTIAIMFGELHQIYVLANTLGLGNMKFQVTPQNSMGLESLLTTVFFAVMCTIMVAFFLFRDTLMLVEHGWTFYVGVAQLYIIYIARTSRSEITSAAITPNDISIVIFEKLSNIQIVLAGLCFVYRLGTEIFGFRLVGRVDLALALLDETCTFLFYVKTLLIKERTNVSVTVA
jgi:hypothetical protein